MDGHFRLVSPVALALVSDERQLLSDLRQALTEYGASTDDIRTVEDSLERLDELFLLVVVGEFNAGKSAVVNVLLGEQILGEGVTPTTSHVTIVRHGEHIAGPVVTDAGLADVTAPLDLLRDLHIVDTPGTNAVLREHEALTREFLPRADLVLFVTSADRPFTESERGFLERVRDWGKKIVFIVNKADILDGDADRATVVQFVTAHARTLLNVDPVVFLVSAREARAGREGGPGWETSGFGALDRYLRTTLDEIERLRLKLSSPLGVGDHLAERLDREVADRTTLLRDDLETLEQIDRQLAVYEGDLRRDFEFRAADIEKVLVEMERRGHDHFDDSMRLSRVRDLIDRARMQKAFEQQVVGDAPRDIDRKVGELIDWLVDADFRQWQTINERLIERRLQHHDRVAQVPQLGRFQHDRTHLIESLGREAERIVDTYDRSREADAIAAKARGAVATSAAIEIGAVGLGAVVATVATTAAVDMTGLVMAGLVATLGLLVIPSRRRQAKRELRDKVTALRERLNATLRTAFGAELQRGIDRVRHHLEPYSRFVRAEQQHLTRAHETLGGLRRRIAVLRDRVNRLPQAAR